MKLDLTIKNGISIPEHELEISTSKAGGPGGQHVNKSETRVTVRWNIKSSNALTDEQKNRIIINLGSRLTLDGDLIIHASESRSQQQNKKIALDLLMATIRKALYVPKKRIKTRVSKTAQKVRLQEKTKRGITKKLRSKKIEHE